MSAKEPASVLRLSPAEWIVRHRGDAEVHAVRRSPTPIVQERSPHQLIEIVVTQNFGRALVLDGVYQSSDFDERLKHESLVHPAMGLTNPEQVDVLVVGGGEGCVVREVLKHKNVRSVCMVELDARVTDLCTRHLKWDNGALLDPKVQVFFEDASLLLPKLATTRQFDIAIVDSTQPVEGSVAGPLVQASFLETLGNLLRPGGFIAGYGVNAAPVGQSIRRQIRERTLQVLAGHLVEYVVPCPFYSASFAYQIWTANCSDLKARIVPAFKASGIASSCAMDVDSLISYMSVPWGYRLIS